MANIWGQIKKKNYYQRWLTNLGNGFENELLSNNFSSWVFINCSNGILPYFLFFFKV